MLTAQHSIQDQNQEELEISQTLKALEKLNTWVREITQESVIELLESMNIYNNSPITPEILEDLINKWYSLEKTDCERHVNKHWEYVHVLALIDENSQHVGYIELRCKPRVSLNENEMYIKSWWEKLEIDRESNTRKNVIQVSKYVYLPNEWNKTFRWSWVN